MTPVLVKRVREVLREHADPAKAPAMQRYMKSAMPFRGVQATTLRRVVRDAVRAHPLASPTEWRDAALELWRGAAYREERYAAIELTDGRRYRAYRTREALPMLEEMIVTGAWWDLVDPLATHHLGDVVLAERDAGRGARIHRVLLRWAAGTDLWKRRAAILCQIRFKQRTDLNLLYGCIEPNLQTSDRGGTIHQDFFIRKGIGWALRQYAWTDAEEVCRYVASHRTRLSALSVREAMRNIDNRKAPRAR